MLMPTKRLLMKSLQKHSSPLPSQTRMTAFFQNTLLKRVDIFKKKKKDSILQSEVVAETLDMVEAVNCKFQVLLNLVNLDMELHLQEDSNHPHQEDSNHHHQEEVQLILEIHILHL
jgi:hypothetical protein